MIVYNSTKGKFLEDVDTNEIENIVLNLFEKNGHSVGKNELNSWRYSLSEMDKLLFKTKIPDDAGISIEYMIPQTSKRIDFIVSGQNEEGIDTAIIIELKQWESAQLTGKDAIIRTFLGGNIRETNHPSYQAWSYAALMNDFNSAVEENNIKLHPCAYLHNYKNDTVIRHEFYADYLEKAPVFLKRDKQKLREFIEKNIKYGDKNAIMYRMDNGKIRPSKALSDVMVSMIKGNQEFIMIDDQKVVYETALALAGQSNSKNKNVLIVEGGPGTGKSVVAINLLVELTNQDDLTQYVSKNAAPRAVYHSKLTGTMKRTTILNMFKGSGAYHQTEENEFDTLIVDEAHRLNEKSGIYSHLGENQIKEIIYSSKFSIFFIDENQKVTFKDIGEVEVIEDWATKLGASIHKLELASQFRCDGSDGYIAWLDDTLQIKKTANPNLGMDYDFKVLDSPNDVRDLIYEKNEINNKARLVAGYCWDWKSKKNSNVHDIIIPEHDFKMRWNLTDDGSLWIIAPESVSEIGCIHTCQGLELDYIGVIIGDDLVYRDGCIITDPDKRAKTDKSLDGFKKLLKTDPEIASQKADIIIKNTYRTLMTRGMKGCYVYFTDKETSEYFKSKMNSV